MKLNLLTKSSVILGSLLMACSVANAAPYVIEKAENGVDVKLDSLYIFLRVLDHGIIHVQKSVDGITSSMIPDYVTVMKPEGIKFAVKRVNRTTMLESDMVTVNTAVSLGFADTRRSNGSMMVAQSEDGFNPITENRAITTMEANHVRYGVEQDDQYVVLATDVMEVSIETATKTIDFTRLNGINLVRENADLTYINPEGEAQYSVSQAFWAGSEALYGLGQYQSGIMNWRCESVRLEQYNQEIAIPFFVSTKNYGIYWHNYSLTDFNPSQFEISFEKEEAEVAESQSEGDVSESAAINQDAEDVANQKVVENKDKNIRVTSFTPPVTGVYSFFADVTPEKRRMRGDIKVIIEGDTIINYTTVWTPNTYSSSKLLEKDKEYEIVFQNTGATGENLGQLFYNRPDFNKSVFSSQMGSMIDYYLICGDNPAAVINQYQRLTGYAPMFPKKSYGFWQCRERYNTQEELLANAREMREREIPFDNIVQDWFYWPKDTKGPEWDRAKYPDPKAMTEELKGLNLNLMVSVWPFLNNDAIIEKYGLTGKHFNRDSKNYNLDFYDPEVGPKFYKVLSDSMFKMGVNSIWLDGSEPEHGTGKVSTVMGDIAKVRNPYSLLVSKSVYDGHREEFPNERVFNLTRSAYSGQQRYGVTSWSGDVAATWEQLQEQIPAGLNFTMAGVPYWTHDIGGFFRDSKSMNPIYDDQYTNKEFIELLTRWFQFGAFSPIFRIHGYRSETEIWRYGAEFEEIARKFIKLRYSLMPYIYSQAWQVTTNGRQLMAPMAYQYPTDQICWELKDQYFFGESMIVAPVVEYGARSREVYLPDANWYDFWSGERFRGQQVIEAKASLDMMPIYVKSGSIIPMGPDVQYATQESDEPLLIKVYPGRNAKFTLYYDDNESYDYEQGKYTEIELEYEEGMSVLTLSTKYDEYLDLRNNPISIVVEKVGGSTSKVVSYKGGKTNVKLK